MKWCRCVDVVFVCPFSSHLNIGSVAVVEAGMGAGMQPQPVQQLPLWRRWTVSVMERTGLMARAEQAIRQEVRTTLETAHVPFSILQSYHCTQTDRQTDSDNSFTKRKSIPGVYAAQQ